MDEIIAHIVQPYDYIQLILTVSTVVIALVSIVYTVRSFHQQGTHNRKSVMPILTLVRKEEIEGFSISLVNAGLGPALIQTITFRKGTDVDCKLRSFLKRVADQEIPQIVLHAEQQQSRLLPQMSIGIIKIDRAERTSEEYASIISRIKQDLNGTMINISFKDIYDYSDNEEIELSTNGGK